MKTWPIIALSLTLTACGGGSGDNTALAPADDVPTDQPNPFEPVDNEPLDEPTDGVTPEPETPAPEIPQPEPETPVVEPEPPVSPPEPTEAELYDGTVYFEIDRVEVYDNSPTAVYMRVANYSDFDIAWLQCRLTAYLNENPAMHLETQRFYTPDGETVEIDSGQEYTTRVVMNAEGYTGHHADKVVWFCSYNRPEIGTSQSRGEWIGTSIYGQFQ